MESHVLVKKMNFLIAIQTDLFVHRIPSLSKPCNLLSQPSSRLATLLAERLVQLTALYYNISAIKTFRAHKSPYFQEPSFPTFLENAGGSFS